MTSTIFANPTIDRTATSWELHLADLTPCELRDGIWYKREDYFAPLGYGGINGAKLRQLIWLVDRYRQDGGKSGILTASSILSPQVSMTALVARHYDMPAVIVLGTTYYEAAMRREGVRIAWEAGADFIYTQARKQRLLELEVESIQERSEFAGWMRLHYGITTADSAGPEEVEAFHAVGGAQAANLPSQVDTVVMTAGSCNSCVSVLYGIARRRPANLRRVVLIGIGPARLDWIERRLAAIEQATGTDIRALYRRDYWQHRDLEQAHDPGGDAPYVIEYHDIFWPRAYRVRKVWRQDGISFHPTYEGKALDYLALHRARFDWFWRRDGRTLFWIVGSEPSARAMRGRL